MRPGRDIHTSVAGAPSYGDASIDTEMKLLGFIASALKEEVGNGGEMHAFALLEGLPTRRLRGRVATEPVTKEPVLGAVPAAVPEPLNDRGARRRPGARHEGAHQGSPEGYPGRSRRRDYVHRLRVQLYIDIIDLLKKIEAEFGIEFGTCTVLPPAHFSVSCWMRSTL